MEDSVKVKVNEVFCSPQGEGPRVGKMSVFVRMSGCNLSCDFCDSTYAKDGMFIDVDDLYDAIMEYDVEDVVFTGGEPALQLLKMEGLIAELRGSGKYVCVETNGTIPFITDQFDLVVVSPKEGTDVAYWLTCNNVTMKFVVDGDNVFDVIDTIKTLRIVDPYMMPKGTQPQEIYANSMLIVSAIRETKVEAFLGMRLHVLMGLR